MTIGIVSYFNPTECREYLHDRQDIPNINKAASSVNAITLGLLKAGHHVIVITSSDDKGPVIHLSGEQLEVHIVSTYSRMPKADTFKRWYMVSRLRKELEKHIDKMDIVHTHWTYDFALAAAAFTKIKPVFCSIRDWSPVIQQYQKGFKARAMWRIISGTLFKKVMANKGIHFIANSLYIYKLTKESYPSINCDIIENPIKTEFIRQERTDYPTTPVFISIAQDLLEERKNYHGLLIAFSLFRQTHPHAKLILIGRHSANSSIYKYWEQEGLTVDVDFLGFVDHDKLIDILDHASALIHPSLEESFGNTLLEGMARRVPVIGGKDSGAVPYVLGQGEYGLLCDVSHPDDIAKAMEKALDIAEMRPILDNATSYLKNELTNETIANKHIKLFTESLQEKHE